jgi:dihydrofolate reductase
MLRKGVEMSEARTRRLRYQVAASLDGFIAGPDGEADWIVMDPDIDFTALFSQFDTLLMGRRTFEAVSGQGHGGGGAFGMKTVVVSSTMRGEDHPGVTVISDRVAGQVSALKQQPGKDIWLFGGGQLFASLAPLGLVDRVEVAVVPVMLGAGIPLTASSAARTRLRLDGHRLYEKSGIMLLEYAVEAQAKRSSRSKRNTA